MPYKDPEKQKEYQKEWMHQRREEWIKENGPCQHCGSNEDLVVDHINQYNKLKHTANIWGLSKEKREKELAECQVLCEDCHKEKTKKEQEKGELNNSKLKKEDVINIRIAKNMGETYDELAKQYNVSKSTIRNIVKRVKWKHI